MKKQSFAHIIVTRFNIVDKSYSFDAKGKPTRDDSWLYCRFDIFDKYCFESVKHQTNQNFLWIILFDAQTPKQFLSKIEHYKNDYNGFCPHFLTEEESAQLSDATRRIVCQYIAQRFESVDFVLTTRLDNDDALNSRFVDTIQNVFCAEKKESVINLTNGLQYFQRYDSLKYYSQPYGHFSTRVERYSCNMKTVWEEAHSSPHPTVPNISVDTSKPMWIEVIHDTNIINQINYQPKTLLKDLFVLPFQRSTLLSDFVTNILPKPSSAMRHYCLFIGWLGNKIKRFFSKK